MPVLVFYYQDLLLIYQETLNREFASHILLIPFMFFYLIYRKRKIIKTITSEYMYRNSQRINLDEIYGVLLCLLAITIYWQGSRTFYPLEIHLVSLIVFIIGCIIFLFNRELIKSLIFPIIFLVFLIPPPLESVELIGSKLSVLTSQITTQILKITNIPIEYSIEYGNPVLNLETPKGLIQYTVDIACSGIYSLIGFLLFVAFISYLIRGSLKKKVIIFFIGLPLIYSLNVMRLLIIIISGYFFGTEISIKIFHSLGGWILIFIGTISILYLLERIFKIRIFKLKSELALCAFCEKSIKDYQNFCFNCGKILTYGKNKLIKRDLGKIGILLLFFGYIFSLNIPVFTLTKGPSEIIIYSKLGEEEVVDFLPSIDNYSLAFFYRDEGFEKLSGQDASLVYAYYSNVQSKPNVWTMVEIADSRASLHRWEACLIGWPQSQGINPTYTIEKRRVIQLFDNPPIIGQLIHFKLVNSTTIQTILYWYEKGVFETGALIKEKLVKISLIIYSTDVINLTYPCRQLHHVSLFAQTVRSLV